MSWNQVLRPEILVFVVGGVIAVVAIVGHFLNDYAKARSERELKEIMLGQGMSVDEIERVILAGKDFTSKDLPKEQEKRAEAKDEARKAT